MTTSMNKEHDEMDVPTTEHAAMEAEVETGAPGPEGSAILTRVGELETELKRAQEALAAAERRSLVHRALAGSGAVDVDAVALVVEASMGSGAAPDAKGVTAAVERVRRSHPALFKGGSVGRAGTMGARVEKPAAQTPLEEAANQAARSGDRMSLLHYLRLRRVTSA